MVIGLIWTFIDVFLIKGMAREKRDEIRQKYTMQALAHEGTLAPA